MTYKHLDQQSDLSGPTSKAAEDVEADRQMQANRAFLDAIEDDEVRQNLAVWRAKPA